MADVISFARVKADLSAIADANGGISASLHKRFWNVDYHVFVDGFVPGDPARVNCQGKPTPIINKPDPIQSRSS